MAIRSFEEVTTVAEMTASSVISAAKGELLARAEVRDVLDVAAAMVRREATLNVDLSAMVQKVVEGRPGPETMQVRELAATPGSAWLLIDVRKNGSYGLSAWDGNAKKPVKESVGSYTEARNRADQLAEEIYARRGELVGATGAVAWIVLPRKGSESEKTIDPQSGIVAAVRGDQVDVYYEGNRMGAENLSLYAQRVTNAAGRLFKVIRRSRALCTHWPNSRLSLRSSAFVLTRTRSRSSTRKQSVRMQGRGWGRLHGGYAVP